MSSRFNALSYTLIYSERIILWSLMIEYGSVKSIDFSHAIYLL